VRCGDCHDSRAASQRQSVTYLIVVFGIVILYYVVRAIPNLVREVTDYEDRWLMDGSHSNCLRYSDTGLA